MCATMFVTRKLHVCHVCDVAVVIIGQRHAYNALLCGYVTVRVYSNVCDECTVCV